MIRTSERIRLGAQIKYDEFLTSYKGISISEINLYDNSKTITKHFIKDIDFHKNTIVVVVIKRTFYRKIVKYHQVNYRKYPVYSDILHRDSEKVFKYELKKGESLNYLKSEKESMISDNALTIISACDDISFYPEWAQKKFIEIIHNKEVKEIKDNNFYEVASYKARLGALNKKKIKNVTDIEFYNKNEKTLIAMLKKGFKKYIVDLFTPNSVFKTIFSFGLRKKDKIYKKFMHDIQTYQFNIENCINKRNECYDLDFMLEKSIVAEKNNIEKSNCSANNKSRLEYAQYEMDLSNISFPFKEKFKEQIVDFSSPKEFVAEKKYNKLEFKLDESKLPVFIELKNINFNKYKGLNIAAVYIIRNKDINKYYIGATMDVEKSFKKMFDNFQPKIKELIEDNMHNNYEPSENTYEIYLLNVKTAEEMEKQLLILQELVRGKFICY